MRGRRTGISFDSVRRPAKGTRQQLLQALFDLLIGRPMAQSPTSESTVIVAGHGRQKVFATVGRCIYCGAQDCDLGDEHIIPQALGGNLILPAASCRDCEREVGSKLEGRLTHKTDGMFAALRLRLEFKSKRPKDRPKSLPYAVISRDGLTRRTVDVPAKKVPRHWLAFVTTTEPGIIAGRGRTDPSLAAVYAMYNTQDFVGIGQPGESVQLTGKGEGRDLARLMAKIAHSAAVAEYGLDAFDPWLPNFILGKDDCTLDYYVSANENKKVDKNVNHRLTLGTWADDGVRIGALIRLFCDYGTPDFEVAIGKFKVPRKPGAASQ